MPSTKKPRKAYRPKGVALNHSQKRDLELCARLQAHKVFAGQIDDVAWNTLAAHTNLVAIIAGDDRFSPLMRILDSARARHIKTGRYGVTGDERADFMTLFDESVDFLTRQTDQRIAHGVARIYAMAT